MSKVQSKRSKIKTTKRRILETRRLYIMIVLSTLVIILFILFHLLSSWVASSNIVGWTVFGIKINSNVIIDILIWSAVLIQFILIFFIIRYRIRNI